MRTSGTLQFRLILSHLLVSLISIVIISIFAGGSIINAARQEVQHNLEDIVFAASKALETPLFEMVEGEGSIEVVEDALLPLLAANPHLHYTIYLSDGTPLIDNGQTFPPKANQENAPEVWEALNTQLGEGESTRPDAQGEQTFYIAMQIQNEGKTYGVIRVGISWGPAMADSRRSIGVLVVVACFVAAAVGLFAWWLARNLVRPIQHLTNAATQLAQGDLDTRVSPRGPQELQHLAEVFNFMAARLQTHVDELRGFAANASHELRTPLTILKLRVEALRSGALNEPRVAEQFLSEVESEVDRLTNMVNDLLDLSRMEAGLASRKRIKLDMGLIADDVCETFRIRAERASVEIRLQLDENLPELVGNEDQLQRVLLNFMDNAIRYSPQGGVVEVRVWNAIENQSVRMSVKDNGPGIAPEHLPHVFERFYRAEATRPRFGTYQGSGSGLGLAIAKSIVEFHGGKIGVRSRLGYGALFWAELPTTTSTIGDKQ
jgi:signal transduction histidine kinase